MKNLKLYITTILLVTLFNIASSQEVQKQTITYTPEENGYVLNIKLAWKFIKCYGEVHLTITKDIKTATSNAYIYNGKRYTARELGAEAFAKPEIGLTDVTADLYDESFRLGEVELGNLIAWFEGCFGQTYPVIEDLHLKHEDYINKLNQLNLKNIKVEIASRNYELEGKIREIEKQNQVNNKAEEADRLLANNQLEEAKKAYQDVLKLDNSNEYAKKRLKEIKEKEKAQKKTEEYNQSMSKAKELHKKGDYEGAKSEYEKALQAKPNDGTAKRKLDAINQKLSQEKEAVNHRKEAVTSAATRNHSGYFYATNSSASSHGSGTQNTTLMGLFRVDYNLSTMAGEPVHRFKFYWEWSNYDFTGYPLWISVLTDEVVRIGDLKRYPDLLSRWDNIKPLHIEIDAKIYSFKKNDNYVANKGTMKIIPEILGRSGEEVGWSQPASANWDELFSYCNDMDWDYFRKIGVYKDVTEYSNRFSTKIGWPKYAFEYSDNINFTGVGNSMSSVRSRYRDLSIAELKSFSYGTDVVKVVWPVKEIQAIIKEYEEREKMAADEKKVKGNAGDFWNSPEDEKVADDFWDTPESPITKDDVKRENKIAQDNRLINKWSSVIERQREKYKALQNPFTINSPASNSSHDKNVINVEGTINKYFLKYSSNVYLYLNGVQQQVDVNNLGQFKNPMVLSNGRNEIKLELKGNGFMIQQPLIVFYEGQETDIRVTLTWNTSNSDLDLYLKNPKGNSCGYKNQNIDNMSLDVDDTNGYGPENISMVEGVNGEYFISVQNFKKGEGTEAIIYIYVNEELKEIKKHHFSYSKEVWNVKTINFR